jgi:hypothetical protein
MAIRSDNDPRFYRRFWIMGIIALGFALWCLKDGLISYPHQRERALALKQLQEEGRLNDWDEYARERGWSTSTSGLGEPKHEGDIVMQFVMAAISGLIGLFLLSLPLRARGRWIEASDTGVTSSWGQSLDFDKILRLDKFRWRSKGIAKITYQDGNRKRRFVLDNYKFDRHTTDAILYELEQRIDPSLITGGPPEPSPEELQQEDAMAASESSGSA